MKRSKQQFRRKLVIYIIVENFKFWIELCKWLFTVKIVSYIRVDKNELDTHSR